MAELIRPDVGRIIVTCDMSPLGSAALNAAATLARRLDTELTGLFVEDANLLRMASLPFAREYALVSAAARKIDTGELEHTLHAQADSVRAALSRAAQALSVPWSFQVVRGSLLNSVLEAMQDADLAVFGHTGQYAVDSRRKTAPLQARPVFHALRQPILTLYDDDPASDRALAAAQALAQVNQTSLTVLLAGKDAAVHARLRSRAAARLEGFRVNVHYHRLPAKDCSTIQKAVDSHHAAALLWHGVRAAEDRAALATLVDALKCPVVLVL